MDRRKKVLFLITKSEPHGGAQRYVYDLATHLPKERFEKVVAAGGGLLLTRLTEAGIRTEAIIPLGRDVRLFSDIRAFFAILALIRREKPDVLHLNSSKAGALGALAGRLCGVRRIIFTAHGWEFNAPRPWFQKVVIKLLAIVTVFFTHCTIAVSEDIKRHMPLIFRKKIVVVHNGIESAALIPRDDVGRFLADKGVPLDRPLIGSIAELHPVKGLRFAIEAIARLREDGITAALVVFGEGGEREKLERLIRERRLEDSVFLLGFVPDAPKYLSACTAFVLPSLAEGLGYAILEAGAASLPVAASRVGGVPEIIENGVSGILVPPRNPTALAEALRTLLSDPDRYSSALHERVRTHFSLERMLEKTIENY